jgi:hypothetical protein
MPRPINPRHEAYWFTNATRSRAIAEKMEIGEEARHTMLWIAESYALIAERVKERRQDALRPMGPSRKKAPRG